MFKVELVDALSFGRKIDLVKAIRTVFGYGLKEAKDFVDGADVPFIRVNGTTLDALAVASAEFHLPASLFRISLSGPETDRLDLARARTLLKGKIDDTSWRLRTLQQQDAKLASMLEELQPRL